MLEALSDIKATKFDKEGRHGRTDFSKGWLSLPVRAGQAVG